MSNVGVPNTQSGEYYFFSSDASVACWPLFDIVAGVLNGDILDPYFLIICLDYIFKTSIDLMKENGFTLER